MLFQRTNIQGVYVIDPEVREDHRGFFARTFCEREFATIGEQVRMVQSNVSWNRGRGTVRGMHFQWPPSGEGKLVRCTRGRVFDAVVDLRPASPTYLQHFTAILDAENRRALYISPGLAHGFQTLEDDTEVFYQMTDYPDAKLAAGFRWNDPSFAIKWPLNEVIILDRDAGYASFDPVAFVSEVAVRTSGSKG